MVCELNLNYIPASVPNTRKISVQVVLPFQTEVDNSYYNAFVACIHFPPITYQLSLATIVKIMINNIAHCVTAFIIHLAGIAGDATYYHSIFGI